MIKNERQRRITAGWVKKFSNASKELSQKQENVHPILQKAELDGVRSQLADLRKEIRDFDKLKTKKRVKYSLIEGIGEAMVKARIMSGMNQKQLADKIGVAEQQIQRYEENNYANAALHTLSDISKALNVTLTGILRKNELTH